MESFVFVWINAIQPFYDVKRFSAISSIQIFKRNMKAGKYIFGRRLRPHVFHIIVDGIQGNDGDRQYDFLSRLDLDDSQSPIPEGYVPEFQIDDINRPETAFDAQQEYGVGSYRGSVRIFPGGYLPNVLLADDFYQFLLVSESSDYSRIYV